MTATSTTIVTWRTANSILAHAHFLMWEYSSGQVTRKSKGHDHLRCPCVWTRSDVYVCMSGQLPSPLSSISYSFRATGSV
ncbi:hypothetical protein EMCRGX_G019745 [Ephydatia muelleri]